MTLRRDPKTRDWILRCRLCRDTESFPGSTAFHRLVRWCSDNRWRAFEIKGEWLHTCPKCQEAQVLAKVDQARIQA